MAYPVEIRTTRLKIREFQRHEAAGLLRLTSDPDVVRYLTFGPTSESEASALVDFAISSSTAAPRTDYVFAVGDATDGLIGSCGLQGEPNTDSAMEMFFVLRPDRWGSGLGTELVSAMLRFGFDGLGLERIYGLAHPQNAASARVMEKAGMHFEAIAPGAFPGAQGWIAGHRYAILKSQAPAKDD